MRPELGISGLPCCWKLKIGLMGGCLSSGFWALLSKFTGMTGYAGWAGRACFASPELHTQRLLLLQYRDTRIIMYNSSRGRVVALQSCGTRSTNSDTAGMSIFSKRASHSPPPTGLPLFLRTLRGIILIYIPSLYLTLSSIINRI